MDNILELKVQTGGETIDEALRDIPRCMNSILHPGTWFTRYWTTGVGEGLTKISNPIDLAGSNIIGKHWEQMYIR